MEIPVNYKPRDYQADFIRAMEQGAKQAVICWSRRAGKDMTCFAYAVKKMVSETMNVFLIFPEKEQARSAFWENVENDGFRTIDHIPKSFIKSVSNQDMRITLWNGSSFQVLGAKNPESLRGANGKLYIFSEFVDIDSAAYDIVEPITKVNGGQIIIQSTPKIDGVSGQLFRKMFEHAEKSPKEYASRITADKYLSEEELEDIRQSTIAKYGNDFIFRQEYLVDWGSASNGTYYGDIIEKMRKDGRIGTHPYDPSLPVYTAWDWGMSDHTAIVFFQYYKDTLTDEKKVHIIDGFETNSTGIQTLLDFLKTKPYNYGWHFFPHDMAQREIDSTTRINKIQEMGLVNSSLLRREEVAQGISRVIDSLERTKINAGTCGRMLDQIVLYKRKYNKTTGEFIGPEHNSASHFADAFRYVYVAIEQEFDEYCEMYQMKFNTPNNAPRYEFNDHYQSNELQIEEYSLW